MNAFEQACTVEAESKEILSPWIRRHTDNGQFAWTDKGRLSMLFQQTYGDLAFNRKGEFYMGEFKAELKHTGNLFLEEWSNKSTRREGWMRKLDTDFLFYHFLDKDVLYVISFPRLREWCYATPSLNPLQKQPGRLFDCYPLVEQKKYDQRNDTCGVLVPIGTLRREIPVQVFHPLKEMAPGQGELFG